MSPIFILFYALGIIHAEVFKPSTHKNWKHLDHETCGSGAFFRKTSRIAYGDRARFREFPWIAGLIHLLPNGTEITYACIGSILNKNTVLTSASCVTYLEPGVKVSKVVLGDWNKRKNPDCTKSGCRAPAQFLEPGEIIIHSRYPSKAKTSREFDIALIRLKKEIVFKDYEVGPICLLNDEQMHDDFHRKTVVLAGWGIKDFETNSTSILLQRVDLEVYFTSDCDQVVRLRNMVNHDNQMCVSGFEKKKENIATCFGDGGGPVMLMFEENGIRRIFAIGIASITDPECLYPAPTLATRLTSFMEWILDNLVQSTKDYLALVA